jgi:hypothetical protein
MKSINLITLLAFLFVAAVPAKTKAQSDTLTVPGYSDSTDNKIFEKVETEASFPGGDAGWRKYLETNLDANTPVDNGAPMGKYTVYVQFIVNKDGSISDLKPLTNLGYGLEAEVIRIITKGPRWLPAIQNGHQVRAYRKQPVTFVVTTDELNVSVKGQSSYTLKAGADNEVSVSVDKVKDEDLTLSISGGTVTRIGDGLYNIKVPEAGRAMLIVTYTQKKKKQSTNVSFEVL